MSPSSYKYNDCIFSTEQKKRTWNHYKCNYPTSQKFSTTNPIIYQIKDVEVFCNQKDKGKGFIFQQTWKSDLGCGRRLLALRRWATPSYQEGQCAECHHQESCEELEEPREWQSIKINLKIYMPCLPPPNLLPWDQIWLFFFRECQPSQREEENSYLNTCKWCMKSNGKKWLCI